ncbi:MAG: phosphodiester glycosidase family protein [Firmicutes bacterium]|nr:phosphodiester glycosidase family protein [Bacillota bacterium]
MEHRKITGLGLFLIALIFIFCSSPCDAETLWGVTALFDRVLVTLPTSPDQDYSVSYTSHPMKVIIDSNQPIRQLFQDSALRDVALKEVRYTEERTGASRLVLEFHYQLPEGVITETEDFFQLEISKVFENTTRRMVEPGVIYGHQRRADSFGPNVVNYLEIDLRRNLEIKLALAQDKVFGAEQVSSLAKRTGAIVAVNGAYFASNGRPLGVLMIDGELVSEPYANRTAVGLGPAGVVMDNVSFSGEVLRSDGNLLSEISGFNRPRLQDELIIYTDYYGTKTNTNSFGYEVTVVDGIVTQIQIGNSTIPKGGLVLSAHGERRQLLADLQIGDALEVNYSLHPNWEELGVTQIIGGGPRLIRDGQLEITGEAELFKDDILKGRAPRTAIGITADHKLLLVTVNGRQPHVSVGMTLEELGNLLLELGAQQAMNLDGGGSTTMIIRNLVLNLPSDGKERPVSNAIVVVTGSR